MAGLNVELLRSWLKLPPGKWPPDHYALLGLAPGEGDTDAIELRVLERMDALRRYQLAHPDLVTEGMNRLAQAQICLTDPDRRAEYDSRVFGLAKREPPKPPPPPPKVVAPKVRVEVADDLPPGVEVIDYRQGIEPIPLAEEEPLLLTVEEEPPLPAYEIVEDLSPIPEGEEVSVATLIRIESQEMRRHVYRQIVRVRRVFRVWQRLGDHLSDPTQPLNRRVDAITLAANLAELRPLLPTVVEIVGPADRPGRLVAALAQQQLAAQTFRSLLPGQRQALAEDWQAGRAELLRVRKRLRSEAEQMIERTWGRRVGWPIARRFTRSPELVLLALGGFALLVALVRGSPRG